jgi:hypothetical protein
VRLLVAEHPFLENKISGHFILVPKEDFMYSGQIETKQSLVYLYGINVNSTLGIIVFNNIGIEID